MMRRYARWRLAWLILVGAVCVAAPPREILDRGTGATLHVSERPWVLALEQPQLAAHARDYVALYAVEIDTSGRRSYHLAAFFWSTVPGRDRYAGDHPSLTLQVDDRQLRLDPLGKSPQDAGVSRWPLAPPARGALLTIYEVDTALLRQLAGNGRVRARPESDPTLPPDLWFEPWRSGNRAFAAFVAATVDAD